MSKKVILIGILVIMIVGITSYRFLFVRISEVAGLRIVSNPSANIFLSDKLVGKTPFEDKLPPGDYVVKLIPEGAATSSSWQGKVKLNPYVLTYVNRELGPSELTSGGEVLTLEKIDQNETQLALFSQPDAATVLLDGQEKGTTPVLIKDIIEGEHDVSVTSPGFATRTVRVQTTNGYKLNIHFQLALMSGLPLLPSESATPSAEGKEEKPSKQYVVIKDTPTGFLRVRSGPTTSATEAARVKPREEYPVLEEKAGWYKIVYDEGKEGWISGRYAEKRE